MEADDPPQHLVKEAAERGRRNQIVSRLEYF